MNYETTVTAEPMTSSEDYSLDDGQKRRTGKLKWLLIALAIIGAVAVAYFLAGGTGAADDGPSNEGQIPVVSVIVPGSTTIDGEIEASGTLAARRAIPVGAVGEGGRVVSVPVDAGDWVNQGQVLVVIDRSVQTQQLASARAQIGVAQADLDLAQANLERALKLVERGFISQADIDRLTATRNSARARVQVAQAQVGELQARNARLNIYAPASGLVLERNVEPGQVVGGGGQPLFTIARGGEMELLAEVGEAELAKLSTGVSADVSPVGSDKTFSGQVWQIAPVINESDRQGTARVALSYAPELRPGGFATATIKSGTITAPILPESAVLSEGGRSAYVYVVDAEGKAQKRTVETGAVTDRGIAITSGLSGTEQVVLRAGGFLTEGEAVKAQKVAREEG